MKITRLILPGEPGFPDDWPKCARKVGHESIRWRQHSDKSTSYPRTGPIGACGCNAKYVIDGVPFCRQHAAFMLLDILLGDASSESGIEATFKISQR